MALRTTLATVTGAALLAGAAATTGVIVGSQTASTPVTGEVSPNAYVCAPLDNSFDYDPCVTVKGYFDAGFAINLQNTPYFKKWKAANPKEWKRLLAYMADSELVNFTPAITNTWFGSAVRDAISMCKAARCGTITLPVPPTTAVPNDRQSPSAPTDLTSP